MHLSFIWKSGTVMAQVTRCFLESSGYYCASILCRLSAQNVNVLQKKSIRKASIHCHEKARKSFACFRAIFAGDFKQLQNDFTRNSLLCFRLDQLLFIVIWKNVNAWCFLNITPFLHMTLQILLNGICLLVNSLVLFSINWYNKWLFEQVAD